MRPNSKEGGVSLGLDTHGTPAEQLQKLFQDCGVSPEKVRLNAPSVLTPGPGFDERAAQRGTRKPPARVVLHKVQLRSVPH